MPVARVLSPKFATLLRLSMLRRDWRESYSEETMTELHALVMQKEDPWLQLAAIKEMMDRPWGKSQQHISLDTDSTIATVYESIDDIRRDLIESGLPLDHLEAPRLLKTIDNEETNKRTFSCVKPRPSEATRKATATSSRAAGTSRRAVTSRLRQRWWSRRRG